MSSQSLGTRFGSWMSQFHVSLFLAAVVITRKSRIPLNKHNIRALWIQTGTTYKASLFDHGGLDITDEEWDRFIKALDGEKS